MSHLNKNLFYPCSGEDFYVPIQKCWKDVEHFWFVDPRYDGGPEAFAPLDVKKIMRSFLRRMNCDFVASSQVTLTGLTRKGKRPYTVQQMSYVVRSRTKESPQERTIHFCRGLGFNALLSIFDQTDRTLDIFYYRGDSSGEGGSGFYWLDWRLTSVLNRLDPDGFIFSDGSNARSYFKVKRDGSVPTAFVYKKWRVEPVVERSHGRRLGRQIQGEVGMTMCWRIKRVAE